MLGCNKSESYLGGQHIWSYVLLTQNLGDLSAPRRVQRSSETALRRRGSCFGPAQTPAAVAPSLRSGTHRRLLRPVTATTEDADTQSAALLPPITKVGHCAFRS